MSMGQYFFKRNHFQIVSASDFAQSQKSLRTLPKIKILRQYRIPVGDPSGTLSTIALKNQIICRMYTTLSKKNFKHKFLKKRNYVIEKVYLTFHDHPLNQHTPCMVFRLLWSGCVAKGGIAF